MPCSALGDRSLRRTGAKAPAPVDGGVVEDGGLATGIRFTRPAWVGSATASAGATACRASSGAPVLTATESCAGLIPL
jgi:hypothetical protein